MIASLLLMTSGICLKDVGWVGVVRADSNVERLLGFLYVLEHSVPRSSVTSRKLSAIVLCGLSEGYSKFVA